RLVALAGARVLDEQVEEVLSGTRLDDRGLGEKAPLLGRERLHRLDDRILAPLAGLGVELDRGLRSETGAGLRGERLELLLRGRRKRLDLLLRRHVPFRDLVEHGR